MQRQLTDHGDKRLSEHAEISANFTRHAFREVEDLDLSSHDLVAEICKHFGLPVGLAADEMTVGELGELAIWNVRLSEIAHRLRPTAKLSVSEIGLKALPSYYVERALANEQAHADRISGSDFGDSFSAPLGLYTNGVDVDRRTFHHLGHITASCAELRQLNPKWIRTQDYASIVLPE